jgi:hypothetical protein
LSFVITSPLYSSWTHYLPLPPLLKPNGTRIRFDDRETPEASRIGPWAARIGATVARVDRREERLAKNEIVFRDVNERIEKMALGHDQALRGRRDLGFLCECSNVDCTLRLLLTLTEYEQARSDSTQFVVALGHELPEIEQVVFVADTYQLVRKHGSAAVIAENSDSRS